MPKLISYDKANDHALFQSDFHVLSPTFYLGYIIFANLRIFCGTVGNSLTSKRRKSHCFHQNCV